MFRVSFALDLFLVGLSSAHRLKHWHSFKRVYRQGKRYRGKCLTLITLPLAEQPNSIQFGISISRKVSKKAVVRNRIKRQLRHACHTLLPSLHQGWHVVITVQMTAIPCGYEHFLQELKSLLIQAEVYHGH